MDGSATTNDTQCNYRLKSAFFRAVDFLRVTGVRGETFVACFSVGGVGSMVSAPQGDRSMVLFGQDGILTNRIVKMESDKYLLTIRT